MKKKKKLRLKVKWGQDTKKRSQIVFSNVFANFLEYLYIDSLAVRNYLEPSSISY